MLHQSKTRKEYYIKRNFKSTKRQILGLGQWLSSRALASQTKGLGFNLQHYKNKQTVQKLHDLTCGMLCGETLRSRK
jgi:hypothetical protein